jgi:hypothetical protein
VGVAGTELTSMVAPANGKAAPLPHATTSLLT